jgi:hypothetical protein
MPHEAIIESTSVRSVPGLHRYWGSAFLKHALCGGEEQINDGVMKCFIM